LEGHHTLLFGKLREETRKIRISRELDSVLLESLLVSVGVTILISMGRERHFFFNLLWP
jgi:hypothetical protein